MYRSQGNSKNSTLNTLPSRWLLFVSWLTFEMGELLRTIGTNWRTELLNAPANDSTNSTQQRIQFTIIRIYYLFNVLNVFQANKWIVTARKKTKTIIIIFSALAIEKFRRHCACYAPRSKNHHFKQHFRTLAPAAATVINGSDYKPHTVRVRTPHTTQSARWAVAFAILDGVLTLAANYVVRVSESSIAPNVCTASGAVKLHSFNFE